MISLTRNDWYEIFYALELKKRALKEGRYGQEVQADDDAKWVADLRAIIRKIGPDGATAARDGVKRCM